MSFSHSAQDSIIADHSLRAFYSTFNKQSLFNQQLCSALVQKDLQVLTHSSSQQPSDLGTTFTHKSHVVDDDKKGRSDT